MFDESAINHAMGKALRRRRRAWERNGALQIEPLKAPQSKGQPDILITEAGSDPVAIETEVHPAASVEKDAKSRLGARTAAGDVIRTAIAVRLPEQWRKAPNEAALEAAVENTPVEWAVWNWEEGSTRRWPREGWITSPLSLLAFAAYQSTLAHHRARTASAALYQAVSAAGKKIGQLKDAGYGHALHQIASTLLQAPNEQTFSMAALILANALVFHELLANRGNLADVPTPSLLRWKHSGFLRKDATLLAWNQILAVNYLPIFSIARDILVLIPEAFADTIITELDSAMAEAGLHTLMPSHDVLSETFQQLIADRKKLASFYTLPETAALLAGLAMTAERAPGGHPWHDAGGMRSVVIADFACGTGTLLSAAYRRMAWLHESAGGDPALLHPSWMEYSLFGVDVLPAAAHLTATILSGIHPLTHYTGSQIYIAPYGAKSSDMNVSIGSLDLLDKQVDFTDFTNLSTQIGAKESTQAALKTKTRQADLCIMNPPYTRNTNHEGERATDVLPAFAAFGLSVPTQKAMAEKLKRLSATTFAHGNAGVASHFLALADRMTKGGGTLAMVLPLTFLSGSSWSDARAALAQRYRDLIVVTISGLHDKGSGFSADTDMAECLLVARKEAPNPPTRVVMVSLDQRPTDTLSATLLAEQVMSMVKSGTVPGLEDAPNGGAEIRLGNDRLGTMISVPVGWGPVWVGARIADYSLAQAAYHIAANGLAWLPGIADKNNAVKVPVVPLGAVASLGPLDRDINGKEKDKHNRPRGPFDVVPLVLGEVPTFPVLWKHEATRETMLEFGADCKAVPRQDADPEKMAEVAASKTHLHINRDWQFTSQPLQAQWTPIPTIGGRAWPSVCVHPHGKDAPCDPEWERLQAIALLLWLNSTPGILVRWLWSNRQQHSRGMTTREVLATMPVLDVRKLSQEQLSRCEDLFLRMRHRPLLPVHQLPGDKTRADLDRGLLGEILGWPDGWFAGHAPLDLTRRKLAAEPSVHGHKNRS